MCGWGGGVDRGVVGGSCTGFTFNTSNTFGDEEEETRGIVSTGVNRVVGSVRGSVGSKVRKEGWSEE